MAFRALDDIENRFQYEDVHLVVLSRGPSSKKKKKKCCGKPKHKRCKKCPKRKKD